MRNKTWLIIGVIALLAVAAGSYLWVSALMDSLFEYRSPIAENPPRPGEDLGDPLTRQVLIIMVDALREDTALDPQVMPYLAELRQQGAWATMRSQPPSYSAPGWTAILTGAWPDINDGQTLNPPDEDNVRTFTQDDIFAAAARAGLKTGVAGHAWYEAMLANSGLHKAAFTYAADHNADTEVFAQAQKWVELGELQLILLHLDQVDYAGHYQGGPISQNWQAAASRADGLIQQIVSSLDLSQDTVIILSDHGQIDRGGHGGQDPITLIEPFVMAGAGVVPGEYPDIQMVDIAPTVAVLLGTSLPASNQGRPLREMLLLGLEQQATIAQTLMAQKFHLLLRYAAAIGQNPTKADNSSPDLAMQSLRQQRLNQERLLRSPVALAVLLLPLVILYRKRIKPVPAMLGGFLYLVLFNASYALILGKTYSLSSVYSADDLIFSTATWAGISLLITWLALMITFRTFSSSPAAASIFTLRWIALTLYLLAVPVLWSYLINGALASWTLPDLGSMFLGFLSLIQSIFVSTIGLVLVGLSALIARFVPTRAGNTPPPG